MFRCNQPFVRAGTMNGNPKCTETPSLEDACCVSVKCTNPSDSKDSGIDQK